MHGLGAAEASATALELVRTRHGSPGAALEQAHPFMRILRDAADAVVKVDARAGSVIFAGAGNIVGRILTATEDKALVSRAGMLGEQTHVLDDAAQAWPERSVIVFHSDGLRNSWDLSAVRGILQCDPAVIAGWLLRDYARSYDAVTVVVLKARLNEQRRSFPVTREKLAPTSD